MLAENLPMVAGVAVILLIGWLYLSSKNKAPKSLVIPQFLFTVAGNVHRLEAEAVAGFMTTEHHGGQLEDPKCVVIHRYGRLMVKPKTDADPNSIRRRKFAYVTRQGDSSVLNLKHLFDPEVPMRSDHARGDLKPRKDLATRMAIAKGVKSGGNRQILEKRLAVMGLISVSLGGIAWIAVTIAATAL